MCMVFMCKYFTVLGSLLGQDKIMIVPVFYHEVNNIVLQGVFSDTYRVIIMHKS